MAAADTLTVGLAKRLVDDGHATHLDDALRAAGTVVDWLGSPKVLPTLRQFAADAAPRRLALVPGCGPNPGGAA